MGVYGMGKAFNLQFARNIITPTQTNRRGTTSYVPFFGGETQNSYNFEYNSGLSGFWGGLVAFAQFVPPIASGIESLIKSKSSSSNATQGTATGTGTTTEDKGLASLKALFGSKANITAHPTKNGTYCATDKNGVSIGSGLDFDEMYKALSNYNASGSENAAAAAAAGTGNGNVAGSGDGKGNSNVAGNGNSNSNSKGIGNGTGNLTPNSTTSKTSTGWYNHTGDQNSFIKNNNALLGKNAKDITTLILNTKLNGALTSTQQEALRQAIIKRNPSVFNSQGEPLANADYSKLDIPTMDWIKTNILKEKTSNTGANSATGKAQQSKKYDENRLAQDGYVKQSDGSYLKNGVLYKLDKDGYLQRAHKELDGNTLVQNGYRETYQKGIYFKNGRHYKLENGTLKPLSTNIKQVNPDGKTWYDQKGQLQKGELPTA